MTSLILILSFGASVEQAKSISTTESKHFCTLESIWLVFSMLWVSSSASISFALLSSSAVVADFQFYWEKSRIHNLYQSVWQFYLSKVMEVQGFDSCRRPYHLMPDHQFRTLESCPMA